MIVGALEKLSFIYSISQDEELARQLVELGYRGSGEVKCIRGVGREPWGELRIA